MKVFVVATKIVSLLSFDMFFIPMMCILVTEINYKNGLGVHVSFYMKK